jgi:hypothetical protein
LDSGGQNPGFFWFLNVAPRPKQKQAVTARTKDKQFMLGKFSRFDGEQCRWRFDNGDESSGCTMDENGQRRRRGWVNLQCDPNLKERAVLVAVRESAACEYELTISSPETCN